MCNMRIIRVNLVNVDSTCVSTNGKVHKVNSNISQILIKWRLYVTSRF